jgi:hypothetical protein
MKTVHHHIICIASQECSRSILKSILMESKEQWENHLHNSIGYSYVPVKSITKNAIHLIIFVH